MPISSYVSLPLLCRTRPVEERPVKAGGEDVIGEVLFEWGDEDQVAAVDRDST